MLFFNSLYLLYGLLQVIVRETSISSHILASSVANMIFSFASTWKFWQLILFSNWLPCEIIVKPNSTIHSLIRRCASAISLGTSGCLNAKRGEFFAPPTAYYITGSLFLWTADPITSSDCWLATDWLRAPCFSGLALALRNIKVIIDCYYCDYLLLWPFNLPHHFIV